MESLRILVATTSLPYPPTDGGCIATLEPIKRLAARGHHVTLCCFGSEDDRQSAAAIEQFCRVQLVHHDTRNHLVPALLNLFSPVPYTISKYHSDKMCEVMALLLASHHFDLVQVEHLHMARYLSIARKYGIPTILRQHNVESLLVERFGRKAKGLASLYARVQSRKVKRYEARICEQADLCLAITEVDAQRLRQLNSRIRTAVVPAGVDTEYFKPEPSTYEEPYTIVSVASMDWYPNVDAVLWFCEAIFPQVRRRLPQARLYVVGKNPPVSVHRLARSAGITVTGFVEDVREYIAKGSVFVVPLRIGSGMRLKILQAMAMGKAIVSTSVGAEGIRATNGEDILLADTASDFAQSITELLVTPSLRHRIGSSARRLVERCYSWDKVVDLIEQVYYDIVQNSAGKR